MSFHWKVLIWMVAGVLVGLGLQLGLDGPAYSGAKWAPDEGGIRLVSASGPAAKACKSGLTSGTVVTAITLHRGSEQAETLPLLCLEDFAAAMAKSENGDVVWLEAGREKPIPVNLKLDPSSSRAKALAPFKFVADIFMALLKMLIVPLILTSIMGLPSSSMISKGTSFLSCCTDLEE